MLAQNHFYVQCAQCIFNFFFYKCITFDLIFSLLCTTFEKMNLHNMCDRKWCFRDCFFLHIVLYIYIYMSIYIYTFYIILWMSESSIRRHTLFFIWLALCIGLYMGTAQHGDQNPFSLRLHAAFPFINGTERLKRHRLPPEAVLVRCMMESWQEYRSSIV